MKTPSFKQINAKNRDVSLIQGNVVTKFQDVDTCPFIGGNTIKNIVITNAVNGIQFAHGLTVLPQGWFLVDKQGPGDVWSLGFDSRFITLKSSVASVTASLWVF